MIRRVPSAGTPVGLSDLMAATAGLWSPRVERFRQALRTRLRAHHLNLVNSGTTAFFIILRALSRRSSRCEVVLPAYTAPSLTLPIRKAGLIPRVCEVDLDTFNLDLDRLDKTLGSNTLCVVPVHLFGLPCDIDGVRRVAAARQVAVVEDAASSFGTTVGGRETGTLGDVGFLSFNRGKNLSTLMGGAIITADGDLAEAIDEECRALPPVGRLTQGRLLMKLWALASVVRPGGYTVLHRLASRFKYTSLHTEFASFQLADVLAGAGVALLRRADAICERRHANGLRLAAALDGLPGIRLPTPLAHAYPVFNQFPVLADDPTTRARLVDAILRRTGVEVTTLYPDPLHRIYDLGYDGDPFPNATLMAQRLLLIPTHPLIGERDLERVVETMKSVVGSRWSVKTVTSETQNTEQGIQEGQDNKQNRSL